MSDPKRIQRRRTKGWRMPEGAVFVGRPTKWGNPWRGPDAAVQYEAAMWGFPSEPGVLSPLLFNEVRRELAGKDLACWCPLDQPCHADVLLYVANR